MFAWNRSEILDLISLWKDAYRAVASGKSYTIAGRSLTYQDVTTIRAQIDFLQGELEALDVKGGGSLQRIICRTVR